MAAITYKNASCIYEGSDKLAVDNLNLDIQDGEFIVLVGPSGSGKSTALRMLAGLEDIDEGSIEIGGRDVTEPLGDYGFVFQAPSLMPWRSVIENVLFPMEILGRRDQAARQRAVDLLDLVGLSAFLQARPHQLSGGMQQRVALCRALIHRPQLLLMDEPFGALDEFTRLEMNDLLLRIRLETKATVLFVTHSISEAVYLSDKVLVFSKRPARVAREVIIDLPYPRVQQVRFTPEFTGFERTASEALGVIPPQDQAIPVLP